MEISILAPLNGEQLTSELLTSELLTSEERAALGVLQQLRPEFSIQELAIKVARQQEYGYQLAYLQKEGVCAAVCGFNVGEKLSWGKHIYIDDFVTNSESRSAGVGKFFLDWVKQYAEKNGCQQVHLGSGVNRFGAHKFYLREGFKISSHHFMCSVL
ncbi:GNAT family N-acetyltransferase [Vibrio aquaticus]|uniref:GNAT family N-acetyltransferase n=1 Tax=Vibrio aquaticus TaxID=2496559 RepID=A0A3S0V5A6_9VIBR|nr:GNAT family N-acetyltransferase [Vibrio aquaticus]RTZ18279.1 GNAT family N-acetyltransferase [Vibrio aquaticus]